MPTPVNSARQCLTEEAARALDDAVAVARRRNHAQTTSLHAISSLLALPSSMLREACTRARSYSFSPRLQFQALELSVGVSLDRLPTSKVLEEDPPVSNSLMAAIKRSQANQRRHPENFHLFQMHSQQQQTTSFLKVELKHLIISILDDPIVSRVFGEAGFKSCDIKLSLFKPPMTQSSRFSRSRYPPIFLCNLTGSETGRPGFDFPFMGNSGFEDVDENCRRIGEVLMRKTKKNPLLMGVYARSALRSFTESVSKGREGVLPAGIAGLNIICIEKEIAELLGEGGSEEKMGLKFKDLSRAVEQCSGPGIAVNFGELEAFVGDGVPGAAASLVVSQLTSFLEVHGGKFWLMGVAETAETYAKFLALFPTVEKDWDLHLLTITSDALSMEGAYSKSSLMGSFVPLGGFFSSPSEFNNPLSCTNHCFTCCHTCNQKYEQEIADILKVGSTTLTSGYSTSFPWLQKVNVDKDKGLDVAKTSEEKASFNAKILVLQKKWSDFCQSFCHTRSIPEFDTSQTRSQLPILGGFRLGSGLKESSSKDPSLNEIQYSYESPRVPKELQNIIPSKQISPVPVTSGIVSVSTGSDQVPKVSKSQQTDMQSPWLAPSSMANTSLLDHRSSSSLTSVTTDLGLGTLYTSAAQEPNMPNLQNHKERLQRLSGSLSTDFDSLDFKSLNQLLTEQVGWQDEAIYSINQTLSLCRSGGGKRCGSHVRADIWFAFLGPDRFGKKKIASALAKIMFGNTECLISLDLSTQYWTYQLNSIFECQNSYLYEVIGRKTVVDYIAGELSKNPHSVVFLENVDKADSPVKDSLFQAIRTGKFPDSHGREINIYNTIFIVTSTVSKGSGTFLYEKQPAIFSEESILEAKRCQMQLLVGHISECANRSGGTNVIVAPRKGTFKPTFLNKRKLVEISDNKEQATKCKARSYLDLNMPVEEVEDEVYNDDKSESLVENSEAWLNDFYDQIDERVAFKPLNFDELADKILKTINIQFRRTFGSEFLLEVDYEVMIQILAATWLSDKKNAMEDWVEHVLGRSFNEAQQKYHPSAQYVMKLVSCEGIFVQEQAPGVCLPARINLN